MLLTTHSCLSWLRIVGESIHPFVCMLRAPACSTSSASFSSAREHLGSQPSAEVDYRADPDDHQQAQPKLCTFNESPAANALWDLTDDIISDLQSMQTQGLDRINRFVQLGVICLAPLLITAQYGRQQVNHSANDDRRTTSFHCPNHTLSYKNTNGSIWQIQAVLVLVWCIPRRCSWASMTSWMGHGV